MLFVRIFSSVQVIRIEKKKKMMEFFFNKNVSISRINSMIWKYKFCQRSTDGQLVKMIQKTRKKNSEHGEETKMQQQQQPKQH